MYLREYNCRLDTRQESRRGKCHIVQAKRWADLGPYVHANEEGDQDDDKSKGIADDDPCAVVIRID